MSLLPVAQELGFTTTQQYFLSGAEPCFFTASFFISFSSCNVEVHRIVGARRATSTLRSQFGSWFSPCTDRTRLLRPLRLRPG